MVAGRQHLVHELAEDVLRDVDAGDLSEGLHASKGIKNPRPYLLNHRESRTLTGPRAVDPAQQLNHICDTGSEPFSRLPEQQHVQPADQLSSRITGLLSQSHQQATRIKGREKFGLPSLHIPLPATADSTVDKGSQHPRPHSELIRCRSGTTARQDRRTGRCPDSRGAFRV